MVKHPKVFGVSVVSSADVERYSLTVKAIIGGLATILVAFGIQLPMGDLDPFVDAVGELVVQVGAVVSSVAFIWGLGRKIVNAFKKK